ncbi:MAG: helix-turn-helix transcriptional regulator [Clostridia bacterium]|nr:helix-turn-helix transcriptional regulator [Clostridia bacterium]
MFLNFDNYVIDITNITHVSWKKQKVTIPPREFCALAFRIKGSGNISFNQNKISLSTNDVLYLPQNIGYTAKYSDTEIIAIHFKTANSDSFAKVFSPKNSEKIYKLFLEALYIWQAKEVGYQELAISVLYKILGTLSKDNQEQTLQNNFINAQSIINSRFRDSSLSIKDVCREAKISETYFRKLFSEHFGKTPTAYITQLRIEHAQNLISNGTSINDAAYSSGFNDPKYFSRVVKKHLNCTPKEFKSYGK